MNLSRDITNIIHYFAQIEALILNEMFLTKNMDRTEKNIFEVLFLKFRKILFL